MKTTFKLFLFSIILASCQSFNGLTQVVKTKEPTMDINTPTVLIKPVLADLDIADAQKTTRYTVDLSLSNAQRIENAKDFFLKSNNCDLIVNPRYVTVESTINTKVSGVTIEVTGFPATYKKIYQVDKLDETVLTYNTLNVQVKSDNFMSKNVLRKEGSEFFVSLGGGTFAGVEVGYFLDVDEPLFFYGSFENYPLAPLYGEVNVTIEQPSGTITADRDYPWLMNSISLGGGYRVSNSRRLATSVFGGLNVTAVSLDSYIPLYSSAGVTDVYSFTFTGIRLGFDVDRNLTRNISLFLKGFYNQNLGSTRPSVDGGDKVKSVSINTGKLNFGTGLRVRI